VFFLGQPFQLSLKFADKARAYPSETHIRCSTLGWAPGLIHRLGWKGLPETNTLVYHENLLKKIIGFSPGVDKKIVVYLPTLFSKLDCFAN
jgi:hypothetical protein